MPVGYNTCESAYLAEAMLRQTDADMSRKVTFQGFLACDQSKTPGKLLGHKMTSFSQFIFAGLSNKVLHDELAGRNPGNRDRSFNNRKDDLI